MSSWRIWRASHERDTELVDLILDWALLFYYRARLLDFRELLDRHQDSMERLDDDSKRMWWLIWRGHTAGFTLDQADNVAHLDRAVEIAQRIGDETGYAYARTWQVWGHFVAGRPRDAIEAAKSIEEWAIANREVDPYPFFKSQCVLGFALSFSGQFAGVEGMCTDVIEFGHKVGNNRCIAFGIQALAMLQVSLGNYGRSMSLAEEASSTAKDPMYRDTAKLTLIAAASLAGDLETVRAAVTYLRDIVATGVQLPSPLFVDIGEAFVVMGDGDLIEGMALLERSIEVASEASRGWEWLYGRSVKTVFLARLASGEFGGDWKTMLRNPRLAALMRRAKSSAGHELAALRDDAHARGFEMIAGICDVEEAKLLLSQGKPDQARLLLQRSLDLFAQTTDSEGSRVVVELLART